MLRPYSPPSPAAARPIIAATWANRPLPHCCLRALQTVVHYANS